MQPDSCTPPLHKAINSLLTSPASLNITKDYSRLVLIHKNVYQRISTSLPPKCQKYSQDRHREKGSYNFRDRQRIRRSLSTNDKPVYSKPLNPAADLDSITSSILYAYLKSNQQQTTSTKPRLHVPLLNIPKKDISLRPELLALLPNANLESAHLITLDDLPAFSSLRESLPPQNTRWILVDHNALQGTLGRLYSSQVVGAIDHHADERKVPQDTGPEPRVVETSGSCTSLVVNYCHSLWDTLSSASSTSSSAVNAQSDSVTEDSGMTALWDAQLAYLALASVLIDTNNLLDENKVTEHDMKAATYLEAKINACAKTSTGFSREGFFEMVSQAKRDLDGVELEGVFRKDYKQWSEGDRVLGVASVVKDLGYLCGKTGNASSFAALIEEARAFADERGLDVFAVMTAFQADDGSFSRELLVLGTSKEGSAVVKKFAETTSEKLKLESVEEKDDDEQRLCVWRQKEVAASRKQVAPLLREAMKS